MIKDFSKEYFLTNKSCYKEKEVEQLFPPNVEVVSIVEFLESNLPIGDKMFFLTKKTELTISQKQEMILMVADVVKSIFELAYPKFVGTTTAALNAAKDYLDNNIEIEEFIAKRNYASIFTSIAIRMQSPKTGSDSALSLNSTLQSIDVSDLESKYQPEYVDNAASMSVKSAADAVSGSKEFEALVINQLIKFVEKQEPLPEGGGGGDA